MATDCHNDLKTTRMQAVVDAIDSGASNGVMEICTVGYGAVLLSYDFNDPCGVVSGDPATLTFSGMPKQVLGLADGTAVFARMKDSNGKIWISGLTVGLVGSGANVEIDSVSILTGLKVNLLSGILVHG